MKTYFYPIVARTNHDYVPFLGRIQCIWMWKALARAYPRIYAAVLMPNYLHLLIQASEPEAEQQKMSLIVSQFSKQFYPGREIWQPIPKPNIVPDRLHVQRSIRYIHLNPCRKKLTNDPLNWEFSTHRDWLGLSQPSLVQKASIQSVFPTFHVAKFHAYVSSDPSCNVSGTALPNSLTGNNQQEINLAETPLSLILKSVLISKHAAKSSLFGRGEVRTVALQLASESKDFYPTLLARELGLSRQTVYNLLRKPKHTEAIARAKHILSDPRLHITLSEH